jgi:hypothetical protein
MKTGGNFIYGKPHMVTFCYIKNQHESIQHNSTMEWTCTAVTHHNDIAWGAELRTYFFQCLYGRVYPPVNSWHFAVLLIPQSETQDLFLLLDVVSRHDFVMPNLMIWHHAIPFSQQTMSNMLPMIIHHLLSIEYGVLSHFPYFSP